MTTARTIAATGKAREMPRAIRIIKGSPQHSVMTI